MHRIQYKAAFVEGPVETLETLETTPSPADTDQACPLAARVCSLKGSGVVQRTHCIEVSGFS